MTYPEETHSDPLLLGKMRKWGIPVDKPYYIITSSSLYPSIEHAVVRLLREESVDVIGEIKLLKRNITLTNTRINELEKRVGRKRQVTNADKVYEQFRRVLEETDFGKIVAIDIDRKEIVGKGDTILEAYNEAKDRTGKEQFDFKRVGYKYLFKV